MEDVGKQVDDIFDKVEQNKGKLTVAGLLALGGSCILTLGVIGLVVWGFIRLILHFT